MEEMHTVQLPILYLNKFFHELSKREKVYPGKRDSLQNLEMSIVRNQELGTCCDGAIHEFVIIGIRLYQIEPVIRGNERGVGLVKNRKDNVVCYGERRFAGKNFQVFLYNLVGQTQYELMCSLPHSSITSGVISPQSISWSISSSTLLA